MKRGAGTRPSLFWLSHGAMSNKSRRKGGAIVIPISPSAKGSHND
jgi:hypothetical protein